jgi:hypothetical protein
MLFIIATVEIERDYPRFQARRLVLWRRQSNGHNHSRPILSLDDHFSTLPPEFRPKCRRMSVCLVGVCHPRSRQGARVRHFDLTMLVRVPPQNASASADKPQKAVWLSSGESQIQKQYSRHLSPKSRHRLCQESVVRRLLHKRPCNRQKSHESLETIPGNLSQEPFCWRTNSKITRGRLRATCWLLRDR